MKKITVFLVVLTTIATAQLRFGIDAKRTLNTNMKMIGVSMS